MWKSSSSWIYISILLLLERRDCRQWSQTWQIMLKWFWQKIKIGRYHLAAFKIISLFLETFTLSICTQEFLYRNNENGNTWSTMFAQRAYHFSGIYSQAKYSMCESWRENFRLKGLHIGKDNWVTYWVNFITVFWINHQPYHSRMLFLKGVFGGLVQQLHAGLWVIEGTRKIEKDRTFVNMEYIFDNLLCWLLIKLLAS